MITTVFLLLVAGALMYDRAVNTEEVAGSKYFYMSHGMSKGMYKRMEDSGVTSESLKSFVHMENRMLEVEHLAVCSGIPRSLEVTALSQQIKDRFPAFDFTYHSLHIKQASEPNRLINKSISC
jgi:hypothetical protein